MAKAKKVRLIDWWPVGVFVATLVGTVAYMSTPNTVPEIDSMKHDVETRLSGDKVLVFHSLTCSHCKTLHGELKRLQPESRINVVYRPFIRNIEDLKGFAFLACVSRSDEKVYLEKMYMGSMPFTSFENEANIVASLVEDGKTESEAKKIAECAVNNFNSKDFAKPFWESAEKYNIKATPTIVYGNRTYPGGMSSDKLIELVKKTKEEKVSSKNNAKDGV